MLHKYSVTLDAASCQLQHGMLHKRFSLTLRYHVQHAHTRHGCEVCDAAIAQSACLQHFEHATEVLQCFWSSVRKHDPSNIVKLHQTPHHGRGFMIVDGAEPIAITDVDVGLLCIAECTRIDSTLVALSNITEGHVHISNGNALCAVDADGDTLCRMKGVGGLVNDASVFCRQQVQSASTAVISFTSNIQFRIQATIAILARCSIVCRLASHLGKGLIRYFDCELCWLQFNIMIFCSIHIHQKILESDLQHKRNVCVMTGYAKRR